jgi:hypothetical protein
MWIKKPPKILGKSLNDNVNFLYKKENIYIMDNHLAAGWAWLDSVNPSLSHNLIHIDRHFDLLDFVETMKSEIIEKGVDLKELSFSEYEQLVQPGSAGIPWPMFRWDNYILNLKVVYPNIYHNTIFATHQDGNKDYEFINKEVEILELLSELEHWVKTEHEYGWMVNLDIDYFFYDIKGQNTQLFTDDVIIQLATSLKKILDKINVLTISLSPECCGGWENSINKTIFLN